MSVTYYFGNDNPMPDNADRQLSIYTTVQAFHIEKYGVYVERLPGADVIPSVSIRVTENSTTVYENIISNIDKDDFVEFSIDYEFSAGSTINIYLTTQGVSTQGEYYADRQYIMGARINGDQWILRSYLTIGGESIWVGGGYPTLRNNPRKYFTDWQRDDKGYPLNPSVWRIDENNLGYPWIWGFISEPMTGRGFYLKTESGLIPVKDYLKTENGLVPLADYVKTENGLVPC